MEGHVMCSMVFREYISPVNVNKSLLPCDIQAVNWQINQSEQEKLGYDVTVDIMIQ